MPSRDPLAPIRALVPVAALIAVAFAAVALAPLVLAEGGDDDGDDDDDKGKGSEGKGGRGILEEMIREALSPPPPSQSAPPEETAPSPEPDVAESAPPSEPAEDDDGSALLLSPGPEGELAESEGEATPVEAARGGFRAFAERAWGFTSRAVPLLLASLLVLAVGRRAVTAVAGRVRARPAPRAIPRESPPPPPILSAPAARPSESDVLASLTEQGLGKAVLRGMGPGERLVELSPAGERCRCTEAAERLAEAYGELKEVEVEVASRACGVEGPEKERRCVIGLRWSDEGFRRQRDSPG